MKAKRSVVNTFGRDAIWAADSWPRNLPLRDSTRTRDQAGEAPVEGGGEESEEEAWGRNMGGRGERRASASASADDDDDDDDDEREMVETTSPPPPPAPISSLGTFTDTCWTSNCSHME